MEMDTIIIIALLALALASWLWGRQSMKRGPKLKNTATDRLNRYNSQKNKSGSPRLDPRVQGIRSDRHYYDNDRSDSDLLMLYLLWVEHGGQAGDYESFNLAQQAVASNESLDDNTDKRYQYDHQGVDIADIPDSDNWSSNDTNDTSYDSGGSSSSYDSDDSSSSDSSYD